MKKIALSATLLLAATLAFAQVSFTNPIIPGFHPDPSVCRVGNKFYIVNSTFSYFPGVPIYESEDLAHWAQIGNVLDRESQLPLSHANSWLGIYATTIRYNEGLYYMITTNVGGGGNFMVTATDPAGPWSEPIWLEQQGIDPSLLFEDGKCYMVSNPEGGIHLCEIDPVSGKQLTESKLLWKGTGGRYPEGPHVYKIGDYYYLLISEGGTELAHSLTVARSKDIYGPYESNPANPILTHCNQAGQSSQIQGTGHGDLVQDENGNWWVVFLAYRNYGGGSYHHLGRETFLAPVTWEEDWPVVNGGKPVELEMDGESLPVPRSKIRRERYCNSGADGFSFMGSEWLYIQNPDSSKYEHIGNTLRMHGASATLSEGVNPTFLGRRQESAGFSVTAQVDGSNLAQGDEAGITVFQIVDGHIEIALRRTVEGIEAVCRARVKSLVCETVLCSVPDGKAKLQIESDGNTYLLSVTADGSQKVCAKPLECSLMSTEIVGGFTGVVLGMYVTGCGSADFAYFDYRELSDNAGYAPVFD